MTTQRLHHSDIRIQKRQMRALSKKQVIKLAGYKNMKALCKDNPDLVKSPTKGPSKKDLINLICD